jgi:hypothetical protein
MVYLVYLCLICLAQGKACGCKIHKDRLTLALFVNTIGTCKSCGYLQISMPKMLGKVVANKSRVMVCKPNDIHPMYLRVGR